VDAKNNLKEINMKEIVQQYNDGEITLSEVFVSLIAGGYAVADICSALGLAPVAAVELTSLEATKATRALASLPLDQYRKVMAENY
jgi:hypothetical protein